MTTPTTKATDIKRDWIFLDLKGKVLGRVASEIAQILLGKNKVNQSDNLDVGDYIIAVNSDLIAVTGKKLTDKMYYRHSGYPGGFKEESLASKMAKDSTKVIELAVKNMLPKNKLQQPRLRRLKVFKDENHPYQSQIKAKTN